MPLCQGRKSVRVPSDTRRQVTLLGPWAVARQTISSRIDRQIDAEWGPQRAGRLPFSRGTRALKTTIEHGKTLYEPKISAPLAFGGSASTRSKAVSNSRSHFSQSGGS